VPLFLVNLNPLFDFLYKVFKDRKEQKEKNFSKAQESMEDLNKRREDFFIYLGELQKSIKQGNVNQKQVNPLAYKSVLKYIDSLFDRIERLEEIIKGKQL